MKKLVCERCGSTELTKQDDMWICNYCGCHYTPEEANKILVDVKVTQDRDEEFENYNKLAFRALQDGVYDKANKYYTKMLEMKPDDWRGVYFSVMSEFLNDIHKNISLNYLTTTAQRAIELIDLNLEKMEIIDAKSLLLTCHGAVISVIARNKIYENDTDMIDAGASYLNFCSEYIKDETCDDIKTLAIDVAKHMVECCASITRPQKQSSADGKTEGVYYFPKTTRKYYSNLYYDLVQYIYNQGIKEYKPPKLKKTRFRFINIALFSTFSLLILLVGIIYNHALGGFLITLALTIIYLMSCIYL
jgi:tetratricopeptide (TPR) repeat protein